jgi:hypothetical protein
MHGARLAARCDRAPGETQSEEYKATEARRGGGRGEFLWFVTQDRKRDQIFPVADIRRMEPPDDPAREIAYIHLSGVSVVLAGTNLRRVLHRIMLNRCSALYEFRPGQQRPAKGEPVIERMEFLDMTKATRKGENPKTAN